MERRTPPEAAPRVAGGASGSARPRYAAFQIDRWSMVRDELKVTLEGVTSAVLTMKHSLGLSVLLTYTVCKKLVKSGPQHAGLLPHVDLMRKANRFGRTRKSSSPQPQAPAPTPEPTPEPTPSPAPSPTTAASHVG